MNEGKEQYERVAVAKFPIKTAAKKFGETSIYLLQPARTQKRSRTAVQRRAPKSGTINNSSEQTLSIVYKGCVVPTVLKTGKTAKDPGPCNSPGKASAEVVTEPLVTKLVWLDEAETVPGIRVEAATMGGVFQDAECSGGNVKIKTTGSILAKLTPAGELTKLLTATFNATLSTGEPEFGGYWEGAVKTEVKLFSEITGLVRRAGRADIRGLDDPAEERKGAGRLAG